jgi:hypothetical protein
MDRRTAVSGIAGLAHLNLCAERLRLRVWTVCSDRSQVMRLDVTTGQS